MLHLDQHLLTPRNFWKRTMDPVEASESANYTEVENGDELCVDELYSVQSSGIVLFHVFVYLSYCIKLGLPLKKETPESIKSGIVRLKNTLTILISQETNSQETALPKDKTPSPIVMLGNSNLFMARFVTLKLRAWVSKAKTQMEPLEVLSSNVEDFWFQMVLFPVKTALFLWFI